MVNAKLKTFIERTLPGVSLFCREKRAEITRSKIGFVRYASCQFYCQMEFQGLHRFIENRDMDTSRYNFEVGVKNFSPLLSLLSFPRRAWERGSPSNTVPFCVRSQKP